ncbi:MAG: biotin--[acetyl-CoA-carboxylase] ligase [Deltaproteobacteria bacterium]|nr:biotin--[acetyl-CoA-carboxylase] ligase [Deltaproteobacteria bacterium]MBW2053664.1 biotin--[acetyl-CoA-carboxylase] ligase [Deltaproteobacteria bacterium]
MIKTPITENFLQNALQTEVFGRGLVEIRERISSTNIRAKKMALAGAGEGTLVVAESQTAGRGRLGRIWHSPPGLNIYFSLILKPEIPPPRIPLLTLTAGLAGSSAIGSLIGQAPSVKWPNDLLLQNRKIAGILAEMDIKDSRVSFVILGIGINVNLAEQDLPPDLRNQAGSLLISTGKTWDRTEILASLLGELERYYRLLCQGRYDEILGQYRQVCQTLKTRVRFVQQETVIEGTAIDVGQSGELIVERAGDGEILYLNAGEVSSLPAEPEEP